MITPQFDAVGGATFLLDSITVCDINGDELDDTTGKQCRNQIYVQKLNDGKLEVGTQMAFTTGGWAANHLTDRSKTCWRSNRNTPIASGEGLIVYNGNGVTRTFRTSGEVKLQPITEIPVGFSVFGNNTPNDYVLDDITVCNLDGEELDDTTGKQCRNQIYVQKLSDGKLEVGTQMAFTTGGWAANHLTDRSKTCWRSNRNVSFKAGEALIVYNGNGVARKFKLPKTIGE